ncbi:MAG: type IV pilus assembly protein PilM [Nitrospina sp.]|nr:type IV pilus assembly protein PilM [Nitrospina sp.]
MYNNLFLNKETPLLAIHIGSRSITIAQLNVLENVCELVGVGVMPLSKGCIVDGLVENPDEVSSVIKKIIKKENFNSKYVVSSIPGNHGVIRKLILQARNQEELIDGLLPEVQHEIPFDIEDVRYDYQVNKHEEKVLSNADSRTLTEEFKFDVIIAAAQQEIINNRYDTLVEAGLTPVIFELETFSSIRSLKLVKGLSSIGPYALFDLNSPDSYVSIVNNGQLVFDKKNPISSHCSMNWKQDDPRGFFRKKNKVEEYFNNKFNKKLQSEEKIDTEMRLAPPELDLDFIEKLIDEASEAFEIFYESTNQKVECIFIHGIGALAYSIKKIISEHFKIPVKKINPFSTIKVDPERFHLKELYDRGPQFAVVMGLALRRFDYK